MKHILCFGRVQIKNWVELRYDSRQCCDEEYSGGRNCWQKLHNGA